MKNKLFLSFMLIVSASAFASDPAKIVITQGKVSIVEGGEEVPSQEEKEWASFKAALERVIVRVEIKLKRLEEEHAIST